jgi:hypothetical protein
MATGDSSSDLGELPSQDKPIQFNRWWSMTADQPKISAEYAVKEGRDKHFFKTKSGRIAAREKTKIDELKRIEAYEKQKAINEKKTGGKYSKRKYSRIKRKRVTRKGMRKTRSKSKKNNRKKYKRR